MSTLILILVLQIRPAFAGKPAIEKRVGLTARDLARRLKEGSAALVDLPVSRADRRVESWIGVMMREHTEKGKCLCRYSR